MLFCYLFVVVFLFSFFQAQNQASHCIICFHCVAFVFVLLTLSSSLFPLSSSSSNREWSGEEPQSAEPSGVPGMEVDGLIESNWDQVREKQKTKHKQQPTAFSFCCFGILCYEMYGASSVMSLCSMLLCVFCVGISFQGVCSWFNILCF